VEDVKRVFRRAWDVECMICVYEVPALDRETALRIAGAHAIRHETSVVESIYESTTVLIARG
jgi:hypothetical protein